MPDFVCPKCGSSRLRRSHTRGVSERFSKLLGWRAYRCREKSCGWRGLIKTRSLRQAIGKELEGRGKLVIKFILVLVVIGVAIMLVNFFSYHEPPPAR